jgi:hypothetical protein
VESVRPYLRMEGDARCQHKEALPCRKQARHARWETPRWRGGSRVLDETLLSRAVSRHTHEPMLGVARKRRDA